MGNGFSWPSPSGRFTVMGFYTVRRGDTLTDIARDLLGNAGRTQELASFNKLCNPNVLLVGQMLLIPRDGAPSPPSASAPPTAPLPGSAPPFTPAPPTFADPGASSLGAQLALARGFTFVFFEQLPEVGVSTKIIRKVAVVPQNWGFLPIRTLPPVPLHLLGKPGALAPRMPGGSLSAVDHVVNTNPGQSPFLSASDRAFASGSIEGTPLLLDVAKIKAAGGQILTVEELVAELSAFAAKNPSARPRIDSLIWTISKVEGEVLIKGGVPTGAAAPITGSAHLGHIKSSEQLWASFKRGELTKPALEQELVNLERAYSRARVVGRVGRVLTVVGVVFTAIDLAEASDKSMKQHSVKPIGAEVIRQVGGWGGAAAGAKIGAVVGAAFGIETGPGAIVTGAVGAIVFGAAGYFGADWIADQVSPN